MTLTAALIAAAPFILALLAISAVFSAAETALTRASRGRMHQLERDGDHAAGRVNRLLSDQETMIGAVLIGYNVLNILSSALGSRREPRAPDAVQHERRRSDAPQIRGRPKF